jgi:hypothetical protein
VAKYKILGRFEQDAIPALVPPDYRERARLATKAGVRYTVVLFAHDRGKDVVASSAVRRALLHIPTEQPILAVGCDFTREATDLLGQRDAAIARIGEFGWTDESLHSLPR